MAAEKWLILAIFLSLSCRTEPSVIDVKGGPESIVWVVQLSDLHFSVFQPERALDFKRLVGPALSMINPSLVLITGDLTDGKSKDLLTMKQEEMEWIEYQNATDDIVRMSGLDKTIFYDLRGNHDCFGVPEVGGVHDFYQKYSINARLGRDKRVQSITLQNGGWKHLFVGLDSTMEIGLRGPTNLFGHPTDQLLADVDSKLSEWDAESKKSQVTKITFGHFPLSFLAETDTGRSLKDVFLKHSLSAYLCGHLHTKFGKNIKRHHGPDHYFPSSGKYYQFNIHQGAPIGLDGGNCSQEAKAISEFWEWEMGDWRKSRTMRVMAIDSGHVSFVDINLSLGTMEPIILPTFPMDSRFMQRISSPHDYKCRTMRTTSYDTIRALIFSRSIIFSVSVKIFDSRPGSPSLVLDSFMKKLEGNDSRGDLYIAPWNWRAFVDPLPDRYWLQVEVTDISGRSSYSQLYPFSINGLTTKVDWKWKEFLVMGCQWASMYYPIVWFILMLSFSMVLIPRAFLIFSKKHYTYKKTSSSFIGRNFLECLAGDGFCALIEFSRMTMLWSGSLLYMFYLTFFPWFSGNVFTKSENMASMTLKGWAVKTLTDGSKYVGVPDVIVVVLPHLCFVVLPCFLVIAAMAAEKTAYRTLYLSLSGKKEDDYHKKSKRHAKPARFCNAFQFLGARWMRKFLLLASIIILWKHWTQCRAIVKAYEVNPFLHAPIYCFSIPGLLAYAIYKTATV